MKTPRLIFSLVSGLLMCLGFPEIGGLAPVMLFAWIPLLLVEDDIYTKKDKSVKVFLHSYLVFLIYNIGTTWWIWNADPSGAIMAFVLNALLMSITFQLFHFIKKRVGRREGYIGFLLIWISFEYAHYHWDLSWPWLNFGNAFANMPFLVQWYSYSGVLGGTLWVLISNLTLFSIIKNIKIKKESFALQTPLVILFVLVVFAPMTYSVVSYFNHDLEGDTTNIIVTQPNIDTYKEKWSLHPKEQMDRCFSSETVDFTRADLILAPETAISYSIDESKIKEDKGYQYLVSKVKSYNRPDLFIGMSSHEFTKKKLPGSREIKGQNIYANHYNFT